MDRRARFCSTRLRCDVQTVVDEILAPISRKGPGDKRPQDYSQKENLTIKEGEPFVVPDVGDNVTLTLTREKLDAYKVVSRLFGYSGDWRHINIVVTDLDDGEYATLVKE